MQILFTLYTRMFILHIKTKTTDALFHQTSAGFYGNLFEIVHKILEKRQDIEVDSAMSCEEASAEAYDILEDAKAEIESMIEENNDIGMDNLLRSLLDSIQSDCWTARGFLEEEDD